MPGSTLPTSIPLVAFADRDAELWGIALDGLLAVGPSTGTGHVDTGTIEQASPDGPWRVSGPRAQLSVLPLGSRAPLAAAEDFAQLCRVEGQVLGEGDERPISGLGMRAPYHRLDGAADSLRAVYAWFSAEDAVALSARRPGGAKGHDHDALTAMVFENGAAVAVADPRLSTTYGEDGAPLRAGVELWLEGEEGTGEYPRRAAAEALGGAVQVGLDGLHVAAHAMRWQSRGQVGDGVYLLVRAQ